MEKVLPESVPTRHLSGPLSPHELQQLFAQAPVGIGVFDHEFRCRDVNGRFAELTGLARAEHPGKTLFDIVPAQTPQLLPLFQQLRQGAPRCAFEVETVGFSRAASPARWQVSVSSVLDEEGIFSGIFLVMRESVQTSTHLDAPASPGLQEMTHLHALRLYQAEARLQHLSYYDPLTDLGNRHLLQERLTLEIETARVNRHVLALLFIDLDGFKLINDNLGHSAGDLLLKLSADRIRHCLRPGDIAIRLGADEFLVLLPAIRDTRDLLGLIEGLQRRLHDPADIAQERVRLSASIGVSLYPEHGQTPDSLISAADNAMHEAKRRGRNGYLFHSPDMTAQTRERMLLEQGLLKAIEQQEFRLLYQPMTDLADGHLSGLEALIRWQHPSLGMISPDRFIPVAEECGLIEPLGEWVMRTACRQGQQWLAEGLAVPRLSVNVSVREMRSHDYVERVTAILAETGFPAERLEIEVTESIIQMRGSQSAALHPPQGAGGTDRHRRLRHRFLFPEPAQEPAHRSHQDRQGLRPGVARRQAQPRAVPYHSPAGQLPRHGRHGGRDRNPAPAPVPAIPALRGGTGLPVQPSPARTPAAFPAPRPPLSLGRATTQAKKGAHGSLLLHHHGFPPAIFVAIQKSNCPRETKV